MQARIHHHIEEIDPAAWDRLAGSDVMVSHGWLRTVESCSLATARHRYVVLSEHGRPVAAAVCSVERPGSVVESLDDMVFGRLRSLVSGLGGSLLPAWTCRAPHGFGSHLLIDRDATIEHRSRVLRRLLDEMEEAARSEGLPTAFVHVLDSEMELRDELGNLGYLHAAHVPLNYLDVEWSSFDEYLGYLNGVSRGARKDIRRHINQNRKRGVEIFRVGDPTPWQGRLHQLLDLNSQRHNRRPFGFRPEFFTVLARNLGDGAVLYAARKSGDITGVSLMLVRDGIAQLPMVGVDHELAGGDFTYFNLAHYRPIRDAISSGVRRMYFGRALYALKRRRGCRVMALTLYIRPRSRLRRMMLGPWLRVLSAWNRSKLPPGLRVAGAADEVGEPGQRLEP